MKLGSARSAAHGRIVSMKDRANDLSGSVSSGSHHIAAKAILTRGSKLVPPSTRYGDRLYVIDDGKAEVIGDRRLIRTMGPDDVRLAPVALTRLECRDSEGPQRLSHRPVPSPGTNRDPPPEIARRHRAPEIQPSASTHAIAA